MGTAQAETLFERRTWTSVQHSIEAVFHVAIETAGKAELNVKWTSRDNQSLALRNYKIIGPQGQIVKEGAGTPTQNRFLYGLDIQSNAPRSRSADTEDWSIKNHGIGRETQGVGWRVPWGKIPEPGQRGSNPDASAAVIENIEFDLPARTNGLKGYKLECIMARTDDESVVLMYPLSP